MTHLLLTVRFLDDRYHGLLDRGGPPEWPPSPFRLFQALPAGVARRGELVNGDDEPKNKDFRPIGRALGWLQIQTRDYPPTIIAPRSKTGQAITRFVPNNDGDKKFDRQERLTSKPTIPTLFLLDGDEKPEVHYVWDISDATDFRMQDIEQAARSLTTLGWGVDMAFATARIVAQSEVEGLKGIRWYPKKRDWPFYATLRTPTYDAESGECTLCDLRHCHSTFINRIEHGKPLKTVDKPKVFDRVLYTSVERPVGRPCAVFRIECDDEVRRFSYPHSKLIHITAMVRHLAHEQMKESPPRDLRGRNAEEWLRSYVMGHQSPEDKAADKPHAQLSYVPLQSIGMEHTDPAVRRVMIVAPIGDEEWLEHLATHLDGGFLNSLPGTKLPPGTRVERIPHGARDGVRDAYLAPSNAWASVTPVILDGHIKKKRGKDAQGREIETTNHVELIRNVLARAGIEQPCEFEWSAFSHFPKMLSAYKYRRDPGDASKITRINYIRPDHLLNNSAVHLSVRFGRREDPEDENSRWIPADFPVPGPITIGAGRHCGFGLMAGLRS